MSTENKAPSLATDAVMVESEELPEDVPSVKGYDFNQGIDFDALMKSYFTTGFQATNLAKAVDEINRMLHWRLSDDPVDPEAEDLTAEQRAQTKCTIFLGLTSNMISCGIREVIRFIVQHKLVDCIVTTGGAIEEDIMKCFNAHRLGDFALPGKELRKKGINRLGNLLVPNKNYCDFEDFLTPLLTEMLTEQKEQGTVWTPSKMIKRMGEKVDNEESVWYWAAKNDIPVFCPAITDGSVGDMIYFHSFNNPGLVVDIAGDIRKINDIAVNAKKTGQLILGGGLVKHHINNANLMRNGADFSVFINTGQEFDGSDSGARPDEAISWGKIRENAKPVKVYSDASLVFPLIAAQTFVKYAQRNQREDAK